MADQPTDLSSIEIEIPFIPASQRPVKVLNEEQDTIVVVGQTRQKRKRAKASIGADGVEATSSSAGGKVKKTKVTNETGVEDEDREAFDFSAIPNILDDNPEVGSENKKKRRGKKDKKGGRFPHSEFCFFLHFAYFLVPFWLRWRILWRFSCTSKGP